jgi:glycine/D-amino acid oxidase-like deaminating enzyme
MPSENRTTVEPRARKLSRRRVLKTAALAAGGLAGGISINAVSPIVLSGDQEFEANRSFWSTALPSSNKALATSLDADVVVIGGGFTGLSAAYYLRKRLPGKRVVLLEAKSCGNGASGRNGGMVLTLTESRYMRPSDDAVTDRRLYDLTAGNIRLLKALSTELGIDCELEQNGALQVLNTADDLANAAGFVERARDQGFPFELWNRERTAATIGSKIYQGAMFDPRSGQVHPGKLVALWKTAAMREGVDIYDHTPVVNIEEGAIHRIETATGYVVRAPTLVLATNAYTSKLGYLRGAVAPVFDYVTITPVLTEAQIASIGWKTLIPFNDSRTEVYYAGLTKDRRIHFGGGPVDYSFNDGVRERPDARMRYAGLLREFTRVFPSIAHVGIEKAWGGSVDMSLDGEPSVGTLGRYRNIFYGIGFSGQGINLTSTFGRIIADLVAGRREEWNWLPFLDRLPPYIPNEPFRWLGIRAALAYTRLTER